MPFQKGHKDFRTKEGLKRMGEKMSKIQKGKKLSSETKEKIRQAVLKQFKNGMPEETKKKISKSNEGRKCSKESRKRMSKAQKGKFVSEETKIKISIARKGKNMGSENPVWKGGKSIGQNGYVWIRNNKHPKSMHGYVLEHRLVMEKYLGRYLNSKEVIHHINENVSDNRIENLKLYKNSGTHIWAEHKDKMKNRRHYKKDMIENKM